MSTTPNLGLTYLTAGQLQPEVTVNNDLNILDAAAGVALQAFSNNAATTTGLTYGYFGGNIYSNGANLAIANSTIALAASATNYVQRTAAGVISVNSTGFTVGLIPMATIVTGASTITTITDARPASTDLRGRQVIAVASTNITLTDAQVNARILSFQGTLTANVIVTFPAYQQEWVLSNETTGAFTLQVQTAAGGPITLASGAAVVVYGNGTVLKGTSAPGAGFANPMTTQYDLIVGGAGGAATRYGVGANGQVLGVASGAVAWISNPAGFSNPMTAAGDLITGGAGGAAGRLGAGTNGYVLTMVSGVPAWAASSGGVALSNTAPWTKNQNVTPTALAYASTVTPDASTSNNFNLTLTGACTLANPTNLVNGMVLNFCIDQDATGGRVLTLGSIYKFPGGVVPTWVTTASAKNFFSAYYDGTVLRCNGGAGYA